VLASTVRWLQVLAARPDVEHVGVIALRVGRHALPKNVEIVHIGAAGGKPLRMVAFYRAVRRFVRARPVDAFFIYQGGPYPLLLAPFRFLAGIPVYQWKAHPHVSRLMWCYARFCDTRVFTSTRSAFPVNLPNLSVIGNGIDVEMFTIREGEPSGDLVSVGRISRSKRLECVLDALAVHRDRFGFVPSLDVVGPAFDPTYARELSERAEALRIGAHVRFLGAVGRALLPELLARYRAFVNVSETALDRAALEAMACGVPVISSNPCVREILPERCWQVLGTPPDDAGALADRVRFVLDLTGAQRRRLGSELRDVVTRDHSDVTVWDRVIQGIVEDRACRA
jgi:glycosyltransferase involved in cell wall biosynthesis